MVCHENPLPPVLQLNIVGPHMNDFCRILHDFAHKLHKMSFSSLPIWKIFAKKLKHFCPYLVDIASNLVQTSKILVQIAIRWVLIWKIPGKILNILVAISNIVVEISLISVQIFEILVQIWHISLEVSMISIHIPER